jgi:hypothetical protein
MKSTMKSALNVCDANSNPMVTVSSSTVSQTNRFNVLRLRYKAAFDACKAIAIRNAETLSSGGTISEHERAEEIRAAEELEESSDELMASTARLGN